MIRAAWRHIGLVGVALLALLLVVACGEEEEERPGEATPTSPAAAETAEVQPASIKWGVWGGAAQMELYEEARAAFREKYPQIEIEIVSAAGFIDYIQKINTLAAGDQSPDVIMMGGEWFPVFAEQGVFQPLDPFLVDTPDFREEDYLSAALEGLRYKEQLWGLPKDVNVNALYYNKDAFDEAGLDYPSADWTWDDLLAAAQALTKRSGGRIERYGFAAPAPWTFIWQNGGEIFDRNIDPTRVRIDEPEAVEALEFYFSLSSEHQVSPTPAEVQQTPLLELFAAGRLAMLQEHRGATVPFQRIRDFEWGIAPLPHQKERASILNWAGWALSSQSRAPEAAWTFIRWLASEEGVRVFVGGGNALPGVVGLAGDPELEIEEAFLESLEYARPSFASPKWGQIFPILQAEVQGLATGDTPVAEGTRKIADKLNEILQSE
jgi:multiple sugar transport system substrate-binding protein